MSVSGIDSSIMESVALRMASQGNDRGVSVLKKQMDAQEAAISKLLANNFNGVGQVVNRTA